MIFLHRNGPNSGIVLQVPLPRSGHTRIGQVCFVQNFQEASFANKLGLHNSFLSIFHAFTHLTWYQLRGDSVTNTYTSGSGAGNPLADIIFAFAITRVLYKINDALYSIICFFTRGILFLRFM